MMFRLRPDRIMPKRWPMKLRRGASSPRLRQHEAGSGLLTPLRAILERRPKRCGWAGNSLRRDAAC